MVCCISRYSNLVLCGCCYWRIIEIIEIPTQESVITTRGDCSIQGASSTSVVAAATCDGAAYRWRGHGSDGIIRGRKFHIQAISHVGQGIFKVCSYGAVSVDGIGAIVVCGTVTKPRDTETERARGGTGRRDVNFKIVGMLRIIVGISRIFYRRWIGVHSPAHTVFNQVVLGVAAGDGSRKRCAGAVDVAGAVGLHDGQGEEGSLIIAIDDVVQ